MTTIVPVPQAARDEIRAFNANLRAAGALLPPFDTPERVAAVRSGGVPQALRDVPTVLPVHERTVPGRDGDIGVRVVRPEGAPSAVYLDVHGGGFCIGWAAQHDVQNALLARDANVAVVSVDYRLAPEHPNPAGANDCDDVARWLLAVGAAELGADRLVVGGDSAGANLALRTALALRDRGDADRLAGIHLVYGVFDLSLTPSARAGVDTLVVNRADAELFHRYYVPGASAEDLRDPALSPLYAPMAGLAPALLQVGDDDMLLDDSLFVHARLRAAGVDAELEVYPDAPHGFVSLPVGYARIAHDRTVAWLARLLA
jgi:acetyl esterase